MEETLDARLTAGDDVEARGADRAPFLVGDGFQVRHAAERGDGTEQLAVSDGDVEREGIGQAATRPIHYWCD